MRVSSESFSSVGGPGARSRVNYFYEYSVAAKHKSTKPNQKWPRPQTLKELPMVSCLSPILRRVVGVPSAGSEIYWNVEDNCRYQKNCHVDGGKRWWWQEHPHDVPMVDFFHAENCPVTLIEDGSSGPFSAESIRPLMAQRE